MWSRASKLKDLVWQCLHFIWFQKWATALQSWEMMVTLEASCSVGLFHQFHHGLGLWLSTFEVLSVSWWERERNSSCMLAGTQPRFTNTGTCILTPGVPHFSPSLQNRFLARKTTIWWEISDTIYQTQIHNLLQTYDPVNTVEKV